MRACTSGTRKSGCHSRPGCRLGTLAYPGRSASSLSLSAAPEQNAPQVEQETVSSFAAQPYCESKRRPMQNPLPPQKSQDSASDESSNLTADLRPHSLEQYCDYSLHCLRGRLQPKVFLGYAVLSAEVGET